MGKNEINQYPIALTIAGSDSGGGAGIQADIKTFSALGVFATSAITAVTAQNTEGVRGIQAITPNIVRAQIEAVLDDFDVRAIKIGMLYNAETVRTVANTLIPCVSVPIILDPVMVATSGSKLLEEDAIQTIIDRFFPYTTLVTPNLPEAEYLSGIKITDTDTLFRAAERLREKGCKSLLIKGGHISSGNEMIDHLFINTEKISFASPILETNNTHGTGCTLSSAIAAYMALGKPLVEAVRLAKQYIESALREGADVRMGKGHGPVNHFFDPVPLRKTPICHE